MVDGGLLMRGKDTLTYRFMNLALAVWMELRLELQINMEFTGGGTGITFCAGDLLQTKKKKKQERGGERARENAPLLLKTSQEMFFFAYFFNNVCHEVSRTTSFSYN